MESLTPSDKNISQNSDVSKDTSVSKAFEPISFFTKDKSFVFAHQKIKKLVAAVYMLTNFLPNEEPVKWSLRRLGMSLLRLNIDLKDGNSANQEFIETSLRENILEIVSLLEVASFAGMVSEMNIAILKKEFHSLLTHIHAMIIEKSKSDPLLKSPFFHDEIDEISLPDIQHVKGIEEGIMSLNEKTSVIGNQVSRETFIKDKTQSLKAPFLQSEPLQVQSAPVPQVNSHKLKEFGPVAVKKNKRQSIIINLLKRKKDIMVKDVAEVVHDCSEKTLQRELLALVSEGILKKEGERRWTRYSLV